MFPDDAEPVLIFEAKMISDHHEDLSRSFLFQYYLNDRTVTIFEQKSIKGFQGGKFLNRMKVKDPQTQKPYEDSVVGVGARLQVSGRMFELVNAAEYTLYLMEAHPNRFPKSDLQYCFDTLKSYLQTSRKDLQADFERQDPARSGLSRRAAETLLFGFDPGYPKQCAVTLLRRFCDGDAFDSEQFLAHLNF
jgi:hypothetical protein